MKEKLTYFNNNIIEYKRLIVVLVLALFLAGSLKGSFFRYVVGIFISFMIILDYDENIDTYINNKSMIYLKYKKSLIIIIESFFIGLIANEIFWIIIKNPIFELKEDILKNTLIAAVSLVFITHIIFGLFVNKENFSNIKYIGVVIVLAFLNSTLVNKFINSLSIIKYEDFKNYIITIIISIMIFGIGYLILRRITDFTFKLKI